MTGVRKTIRAWVVLGAVAACAALAGMPTKAQNNARLRELLKARMGLSDAEFAQMQRGEAVAKNLQTRNAGEMVVVGAVYIRSTPEKYLALTKNYARLKEIPGYVAIGPFGPTPQVADVAELRLDERDFESLKSCRPGDCEVQLPSGTIESFRRTIRWSDGDASEQVNQMFRKKLVDWLREYQRQGNAILGEYHDKKEVTNVAQRFSYLLSYSDELPNYLPAMHRYLMTYPQGKPAKAEDSFYWETVKFGLKPTVRVIHVVTLRGSSADEPMYTIASKQLYSSHYFEAALDLTFCIAGGPPENGAGFYLVKLMGSEQAGLTGWKGSIVRRVALDRSATALQRTLQVIKQDLESMP